ncbi:MAG: magnesium transporter CorA family protein [Myxococcota bacterium]
MVSIHVVDPEGRLEQGGEALIDRPGIKWIDVEGPDAPTLEHLATRFGLHKLAVEDCLHLDQRPKLEEYPNHLFVVMQSFTAAPDDLCALQFHEMHFLLGPDWVISVHEQASVACETARKRLQTEPGQTLGRGPDFAMYMLADALVDQNFSILDRFNDELEDLEDRIFSAPEQRHLERISQLKRSLVWVRRVLSPQRDIVGLLSRRGLPFVQERTTLYFRDVFDHLVRVYEQIEAGRDLVANAMEAYLSVMANRTNDITKQLTIFASIFLPLSFLTGFFGQNFEVLSQPIFLWGVVGLTVGLPVGLLGWFKYRGWL